MDRNSKNIFNKDKKLPKGLSPKGKGMLVYYFFLVFSCSFSFLGGYFFSSFTMKENYSLVYENLLSQIDEERSYLTRKKAAFERLRDNHLKATKLASISGGSSEANQTNNQALFSAIANSEYQDVALRCKICAEIKKILANSMNENSSEINDFLEKNCQE